MAREIYLWDNLNIALRSIGNNLAHIILGVVATPLLIPLAIARPYRAIATTITTHLSELRVRLNLYAPRLIVGKV
jgi:hypothetical protein